jgi:hypothetical protein
MARSLPDCKPYPERVIRLLGGHLNEMADAMIEAELLLPLMHGQEQMSRPHCPRRKVKLLQALEVVRDAFHTHPHTE